MYIKEMRNTLVSTVKCITVAILTRNTLYGTGTVGEGVMIMPIR
jgi:hypothetical protein